MKRAAKRLLSRVAPAPHDPGFRVLLYHAVDEPDSADRLSLRVAPQAFRAQMELLHAEGYRVVPLRDVLNSDDGHGPRVAITFDDGYQSQLQAVPVLEEFGFSATFFVVSRFLDGETTDAHYWEQWKYMRWEDIRRLAGTGFEMGCHSASHQRLTGCSPASLEVEIRGAKSRLEDFLGQPVLSFSYPHGATSRAVQRLVQNAGYRLACTSFFGANRAPVQSFAVRRTEVSGADSLIDFRRKLQGRYDWLGHWQRGRLARALT